MENKELIYKEDAIAKIRECRSISNLVKKDLIKSVEKVPPASSITEPSDYPSNLARAIFEEDNAIIDPAAVDDVLDTISEREKSIIQMRFRDGLSREAIGEKYGVTRERIRQIEAKALRKLSHPSRMKRMTMVSRKEYDEMKDESRRRYSALLEQYNTLRKYTVELHNSVIKSLPEINDVLKLISETALSRGFSACQDIPIEDLELSIRPYNCLKRHGIKTAREVERMTMDEIQKVRNLGLKSVDEIRTKLKEFGFSPEF